MTNLRQLLSDSSKTQRKRRHTLNILITLLAWLVEFIGGFTIILGSFIFGHGNSVVTLTLQTLTMLFYFVILPCTFLINEDRWKNAILESNWYPRLIWMFDSRERNRVDPSQNAEYKWRIKQSTLEGTTFKWKCQKLKWW